MVDGSILSIPVCIPVHTDGVDGILSTLPPCAYRPLVSALASSTLCSLVSAPPGVRDRVRVRVRVRVGVGVGASQGL